MTSNNDSMPYKSKWVSLINKGVIVLLGVLLPVFICYSYLIITRWSEHPLFIKIVWPILLGFIFLGIITAPLKGMIITQKGTILFFPDLSLKRFNIKDLERMAITFNEWENDKYSALVKFIYRDGRVFIKDYSELFRDDYSEKFIDIKTRELVMSLNTITKRRVKKICNKLLDLDFCAVAVVDKNSNITYQKKIK